MNNIDMEAIEGLSHSPLRNYILAGLESHLVGATTRLFRNTRASTGIITPHSHRFDFQCLVLQGSVTNTLFIETGLGDEYQVTQTRYLGSPGKYETMKTRRAMYLPESRRYVEGDWYGMTCEEIHSISFSRDAVVLFIEGAQITDASVYIEPHVDGETIPTMKTEPWMFAR